MKHSSAVLLPFASTGYVFDLQVRRRHREQLTQLLKVTRKVDLLESRFASVLGHWPPQRSATAELERQLSALEAEMGPSASGKSSNQPAPLRIPFNLHPYSNTSCLCSV